MTAIDRIKLQKAVHEMSYLFIKGSFGDRGSPIFEALLTQIKEIYHHVDPQQCGSGLIIVMPVEVAPLPGLRPVDAITKSSVSDISGAMAGKVVIAIDSSANRYHIWKNVGDFDIKKSSRKAFIYHYKDGAEHFYAKGKGKLVEKIIAGATSLFAIQTFTKLKDALDNYGSSFVRLSACPTFDQSWTTDKRIHFVPKPEIIMRKSLTHYLKVYFGGDAEVRPEQIVDQSHPVDIKVSWTFTNRLALIEIKWLGQSVKNGRVTSSHGNSRAQSGAKQLADYLKQNMRQAPNHYTRGYLVVIDARRRGANANLRSIDASKGMYYSNRDLTFTVQYHEKRDDFHAPIRMFAEPVCD
jgi:hypothetical protein